ncbi:MAG TPA: hypothetical protein PKC58_16695, partial [Ignavibacteria bacterium]|nr:hypothetical protein [Ignavibacteria bacterium]
VSSRQHLSVAEGGMGMDDTYFVNEQGNYLGFTRDNHADAVVVVSNDNLSDFRQSYGMAVMSPNYIDDEEVAGLRNFGDKYYVSNYDELWDKGQSIRHSAGHNGYKSNNGNGSWIPEVSVSFRRNSSNEVIPDWKTFEDHEDPTGNAHFMTNGESFSHTHPAADGLMKGTKGPFGMNYSSVKEPYPDGGPPSTDDHTQARGANSQGLFHVAVSKDYYHFYKGDYTTFSVRKSIFK